MIIVADGNQDSRSTRKDYSESSKIEKVEQKSKDIWDQILKKVQVIKIVFRMTLLVAIVPKP